MQQIGHTPAIDATGNIRLPGFPTALAVPTYLPLVHLYTQILEASRILDRYRDRLRLLTDTAVTHQAPLTALTPSTLMPHLYYKREDQTITKAYKVRGAVVAMAKAMESQSAQEFLTVSTGNHALGILKAAELLKPKRVRLVVPTNTLSAKLAKLQQAVAHLNHLGVDAELLFRGDTFDDARTWAMAQPQNKTVYLDPYNDPWVVAGQGTLGLELVAQVQSLLQNIAYTEIVVIAPVGGGGLLTGTAAAFKMAAAWQNPFHSLSVRFIGLRLSDLNAPLGDAIRVGTIAPLNHNLLNALNVDITTMTNEAMAKGVQFVEYDLGQTVEGASGGSVSPVLSDVAIRPNGKRFVVSLLSGANTQ